MPARRALLTLLGAALAGLAGCSGRSTSGGTPTGTPTESPTATVAPAYDVLLKNEFDPSSYTFAGDDATATIHVEVTKVLDTETLESEVVFERHVEVEAPVSRSWPDAFASDEDAAEFVLSARYDTGHEADVGSSSMRDTFRFAPGSYSTPDTETFTVRVVAETPSSNLTQPKVTIEA